MICCTFNQTSGVSPPTNPGRGKPTAICFFWRIVMKRTAILIDGGFYRSVAYNLFGETDAKSRADQLEQYCRAHINDRHEERELYRIFYYDCLPSTKIVYHPLLKKQIDLGKSSLNEWMNDFNKRLYTKRKFAVRLGRLSEERLDYALRPEVVKKLCRGVISAADLKESDFVLNIEQKGVDMMIGVDIASLAYKKQVDQIILISGDSDFVPAAKLARREGIDFILDPMQMHIKDDLIEHIDGIQTRIKKQIPETVKDGH